MESKIIQGDCIEVLKTLDENSVDAIVTDPPYGLEFMGKEWDKFGAEIVDFSDNEKGGFGGYKNHVRFGKSTEGGFQDFNFKWAVECLRVLKPGGYLLAFSGTRTCHRMISGIEDAGFEIRDMIAWIYGSGFPKSLNVGKAVDKLQGNDRKVVGKNTSIQFIENGVKQRKEYGQSEGMLGKYGHNVDVTKGTSKYEGWGTALKPAFEPITVTRKPLSEKTVAENVLKWGTGGINIDGCRVGTESTIRHNNTDGIWSSGEQKNVHGSTTGRFPANLIHDGSDEVVDLFPDTKTNSTGKNSPANYKTKSVFGAGYKSGAKPYSGNSGSASRFFYCAKASKSERNRGCEELDEKTTDDGREVVSDRPHQRGKTLRSNNHPTVKPLALMEYLVKLVSREGALVLDPFTGSGSTLIACKNLGRDYIGIELMPEYIKIAEARLKGTPERLI